MRSSEVCHPHFPRFKFMNSWIKSHFIAGFGLSYILSEFRTIDLWIHIFPFPHETFKDKSNLSSQDEIITGFIQSFEGLTVAGNLTTEIISVSVSLMEQLNELMTSEVVEPSFNQSELQVISNWEIRDKKIMIYQAW